MTDTGESPPTPEPERIDRQPARQPLWTAFLTPAAILLGAAAICGVLWVNDDDDDTVVPASGSIGDATEARTTPDAAGDGGSSTVALDLRGAFEGYAEEAGLDVEAFGACYEDVNGADTINAHLQRGVDLGINATPSFVINNKMVVGAQSAAIFDEVIAMELSETPPDSVDDYSATIQQLAQSGRFTILDAPVDVSDAVILGDPDAPVMFAEFSDYQCPFCRRWENDYGIELRDRLGDEVAVAFLHFPLQQLHPNAPFASIAAACAAEQDRFWEMHDVLFARQDEWSGLPR